MSYVKCQWKQFYKWNFSSLTIIIDGPWKNKKKMILIDFSQTLLFFLPAMNPFLYNSFVCLLPTGFFVSWKDKFFFTSSSIAHMPTSRACFHQETPHTYQIEFRLQTSLMLSLHSVGSLQYIITIGLPIVESIQLQSLGEGERVMQ